MTVLFLTTMMPGARVTGSEVVSGSFIEAMRKAGHRVIALAYRRIGSGLEVGEDEICAGDRHIETRGAGLHPYWWMGLALASRQPYSSAKYRSRRYRQELASALERYRPGLIVVDHAQMSWALSSDLARPIAYLAHNIEHHLYAQAAERSRRPMRWVNRRESRRIEAVERSLVHAASQVWALSPGDAKNLERLGSRGEPVVFNLPPTLAGTGGVEARYDVGMIGSWTWEANADGLRWFVEEVAPLLPADTSVGVAGAGAEQITAGRRNLSYHGRVPDAAAFLAGSRVIAVPSVAGAGVQVKTVDAIGMGKPVVATGVALRGIDAVPPTVQAADDPARFAEALVDALTQPMTEDARAEAQTWTEQRRLDFETAVAEAVSAAERGPVAA